MVRRLLIRVGRVPLVIGLLIGAAVVLWTAVRSYRKVWLRPAEVIAVPLAPVRDGPLRDVHAHSWWLAIRAYEHLMDSLRKDSVGVRRYDSIIFRRPGMIDSLRQAEEFFYLQDHLKK